MTRRRVGAAAVVLAAALAPALPAGPAVAGFGDTATAAPGTFATATLAPPTGLSVALRCTGGILGVVLGTPLLDLTWTRSSSTWAAGQQVLLAGTSAGPFTTVASTSTALTASSTSATVTGTAAGATLWVVVRTTYGSWSATSAPVQRPPTLNLLGLFC